MEYSEGTASAIRQRKCARNGLKLAMSLEELRILKQAVNSINKQPRLAMSLVGRIGEEIGEVQELRVEMTVLNNVATDVVTGILDLNECGLDISELWESIPHGLGGVSDNPAFVNASPLEKADAIYHRTIDFIKSPML